MSRHAQASDVTNAVSAISLPTPVVLFAVALILAVIVMLLYGIPAYQRRKRKKRYRRTKD